MLRSIVQHSLRLRGIVVAAAMLVMGVGIYQTVTSSLDVFPDFVPPQVTIQTEVPGLAPEQVEKLVTNPIEAAVSGIAGMASVRSESIQGLSVVTVTFEEKSDILADRQLLTERMTEVGGRLPKEAKAPTLSPLVSSTMDLLKVGLTSEHLSPRELRSFADWKMKPLLLAVAGVADVSVVGGEVRQMQIRVDPQRLMQAQLRISDVIKAASEATGVRGAGYIENVNQRLLVIAEGQFSDPENLGATVIKGSGGEAVRLRDIATIEEGSSPKFGDALINGKPGVLLAMTSQYETNTLEVTRRVERALAEFGDALSREKITLHLGLHRPANFIEVALVHIRDSLAIGTVLVLIMLLIFLRSPRTALISFISIPLSLFSAMIVFRAFGVTLNTMTLGGFAVAIGVVVDDAIIDVENIVRRLRENAKLEHPLASSKVILEASVEVRGAIVYATLIVIAAFIPVFMLEGIQGRFFMPLGLAFVMATLASLVVAITVTPALCSFFLRGTVADEEPFYLRVLRRIHRSFLHIVSRIPRLSFLLALIILVGTGALVSRLKTSFLPDFREGHFVAQFSMIPGTSLTEMMRLGTLISNDLLADPRIQTVQMQAGRSEQGVDTWGPERAELHIELKPDAALNEAIVQNEIRKKFDQYAGVQSEVLTFLGDRIGESLSGETAQIVLSLYGENLDALEKRGREISQILSKIPGTTDVSVKSAEQAPRLAVDLKPAALTQFGLRPAEVLDAVQAAYQGSEVAQLYENGEVVPIVVTIPDSPGRTGKIGQLPLLSGSGTVLQLSQVANIYSATGRASIEHDGGRRRQIITCNAEGRSVAEVAAEARKTIRAQATLDPGMQLIFTGAAEAEAEAHRNLIGSSLLAVVLVIGLLWIAFRSARNVTLVMVNLPFALVGGIVALYFSGLPISLGALVGMVTLFGISSRNAIMMLSHYEHLVGIEGAPWTLETAIRGASERLIPVLMTASITGFALLPIALKPQAAGQEIEGPMAIVILGGLVSSTFLTLILLPSLALRFGKFQQTNVAPAG